MEEDLAKKLKSYYATPGDAPTSVRFDGWTQDDFDALDRYLTEHWPKTWEESIEQDRRLAAGIL